MKYWSLITLMILFSCKSTKEVGDLKENEVLISMSKGACFGTCPVYSLEVYKGGYAIFYGKRNTAKKGKHSKKINEDQYKALIQAFKDSNFEAFENHYESNIPDLPSVSISYKVDGAMKEVTGKRERPEVLHKLQFRLEEIAESKDGWTQIAAPEEIIEEEKQKILYDQIIVQTQGGPQLAKWFDTMRKEHSVRIIRKLDNAGNKWLVSYNQKKYTGQEMLAILQKDEFVESAEFNVETQKR